MFNRTNLLIVVVALLGAALGLFVGRTFDAPAERPVPEGVVVLKTGDMRPDVTFPDLDNRQRRLSEWDGKVVLLNFWATWCGPCREEMPLLDQTRGQNGLEIIGLAVDDVAAVKVFLKENPVGYPILIGDDDENPELLFGDTRSVLPFSVLIGKDGKLLAQHAGSFTPNLLRTWLSNNIKQAD